MDWKSNKAMTLAGAQAGISAITKKKLEKDLRFDGIQTYNASQILFGCYY